MPGAAIRRRERPYRGGSVASGPGTERMQPGSRHGGHPASRGGLARGELLQRLLLRWLLLRWLPRPPQLRLLRVFRWSADGRSTCVL